jgi:hypothetical protein
MRSRIIVGLALVMVPGTGMLTPAFASRNGAAVLASIVVKAIDRNGHRTSTAPPIAMSIGTRGRGAEYQADTHGVIRVPAGSYLVAADIATAGSGGHKESDTLIARTVRAAGRTILTLDSRRGRRVSVALLMPGAQPALAAAALCGRGALAPGPLASAGSLPGHIYAAPSRSKYLRFSYGSSWTGADGTLFQLGGSRVGVPRIPRFTFRPSDLAKLTLAVKARAMEGTSGTWSGPGPISNHCPVGLDGGQSSGIPGKVTQFVSQGTWAGGFRADDIGDVAVQVTTRVGSRDHYTTVIGRAAYGPGPSLLPRFLLGLPVTVSLLGLFSDPVANTNECSANVSMALRAHGRVVKSARFRGCNGAFFRARLHPGWYDASIRAVRVAPSAALSVAPLSSRIGLSWHFGVSRRDVNSVFGVPVSVTRFVPDGLDMRNNAQPRAVTPIRLTVFRGRPYPAFKIRHVGLEVSFNDGKSWHSVPLTAPGRGWLAKVRDPASGFVSLRSTVTDIKGDRTVETINRAYGIG